VLDLHSTVSEENRHKTFTRSSQGVLPSISGCSLADRLSTPRAIVTDTTSLLNRLSSPSINPLPPSPTTHRAASVPPPYSPEVLIIPSTHRAASEDGISLGLTDTPARVPKNKGSAALKRKHVESSEEDEDATSSSHSATPRPPVLSPTVPTPDFIRRPRDSPVATRCSSCVSSTRTTRSAARSKAKSKGKSAKEPEPGTVLSPYGFVSPRYLFAPHNIFLNLSF
jgi:hypothetical protein